MAVQFIIGRAGTGKTHAILERLVAHVSPDPLNACVIYLVPKQATFNTQRAIAADPRLGGFCNVRVIAPDDLADLALLETGCPVRAKLDSAGRALILGHLLTENAEKLQHFRKSASRQGLAAQIDQAFGEFERAGRDIRQIDEFLDSSKSDGSKGDGSSPTLVRKLSDLRLLYAAYQTFLKERQFDPYEQQLRAPEAIGRWAEARGALVLVDDFYDFTAYERQLIVALAKVASQTLISLMIDPTSPLLQNPDRLPNELGLFYRTETTYRRLYFDLHAAGLQILSPLLMKSPLRFANRPMQTVERALDNRSPKPVPSDDKVCLVMAADTLDELHTAAREIQRFLKQGYRQRDICVLARSIGDYAAYIEDVFSEYGLSHFLDRPRDAIRHPLAKTLQAIFQIVQTRWSHESVFELVKAGLTPLPNNSIDLLQAYVNEHRLLPHCWTEDRQWTYARAEFDEAENYRLFTAEEVTAANVTRSLIVEAIGPVGTAEWAGRTQTLRVHMGDLFAVLDRFQARQAMLHRIKIAEKNQDAERQAAESQLWTQWIAMADQLIDLLGDTELTGHAFTELMQSAVAGLELTITPPTIDQVLVGSIDRTRTGPVRIAIVLGLNECQFPLCERERAVLNDADRTHLLRGGIEIDQPSVSMLMAERFLGYLAISRASDRIVLIRVTQDRDGNPQQASPYWDAIEYAVLDAKTPRAAEEIERTASARQAVALLLRWARTHGNHPPTGDEATLYQWLTSDSPPDIRSMAAAVWPALEYRNLATLSPAAAGAIFNSPLEASVSRFESFAACPYQHFARYGLRLQKTSEREFTEMDLGSMYHEVLEHVVRDTLASRADFADRASVTPQQVREVARVISEKLSNQVFMSSARSRHALEQVESTVQRLIRAQQTNLASGDFRPAFTELTFGDRKRLPCVELNTPAGHVVRLRGKIDRVDLNSTKDVFSVVDYKLGGKALDYAHVTHGLMLQLLTYLLVLQQHGSKLSQRPLSAAGALYVKVLRGLTTADHPSLGDDPDSDAFHLKEKPRGVISRLHVASFDRALANGGESKAVAVKIKKDGQFWQAGNDAVETADLAALVRYVEQQIIGMADSIIGGNIAVDPYMIGKQTACQRCDLQRVCRIDRALNGYRMLPQLSREQALEQIRSAGAELGQ